MGHNESRHICPVERAGSLDNRIRRWVQNPRKILAPYLREGMTVLDVGCGPGFFSVEMGQMVGRSGRVIAADLQEGMLQRLRDRIRGTELEERIRLHKCEETRIGVSEQVDFVLAFYIVHEVPDQGKFFDEVGALLEPDGKMLLAEPPFHVSKRAFEATVAKARDAGLVPVERPKLFLSKSVILKKG